MSAFTLIATPLLIGFQIWLYGLPEHGTTMNPLLLPVFDIETVRQTINTSSHEVITSGVGENLVEAAEGVPGRTCKVVGRLRSPTAGRRCLIEIEGARGQVSAWFSKKGKGAAYLTSY